MSGPPCPCRGCTVSYEKGVEDERNKIIAYLKDRADDLNSCGKQDSCNDSGYVVYGCITDIQEGYHEQI